MTNGEGVPASAPGAPILELRALPFSLVSRSDADRFVYAAFAPSATRAPPESRTRDT